MRQRHRELLQRAKNEMIAKRYAYQRRNAQGNLVSKITSAVSGT